MTSKAGDPAAAGDSVTILTGDGVTYVLPIPVATLLAGASFWARAFTWRGERRLALQGQHDSGLELLAVAEARAEEGPPPG